MEAGRHLRMLKWGRDMEMGNGPWTTMAVRKGEKVNCKHFRIPDFHPIQQERSKSYLHDNTLPGDQSVQGGFTLHLPCSHLFLWRIHSLYMVIWLIIFHPGSCSENWLWPPHPHFSLTTKELFRGKLLP